MRRWTLEIKLPGVGGHSSISKVVDPEFRFSALTLKKKKTGIVAHVCSPGTGEVEMRAFLELTG